MSENGVATETKVKDHLVINLPDFEDHDNTNSFYTFLGEHQGRYGIKTLVKHCKLYQRSVAIADAHMAKVKKTIQVIAGNKTPAQRKYHKSRTLNSAAWAFFDKLSAEQLRMQCNLFGVDYDGYEDIDDRLAALVAKVTGTTVEPNAGDMEPVSAK